jgi:phosphoribosyl 1,2-cyclic phosphodiesterase
MVIKFYGTRGSVAVANKETKKYGGNTTCFYVESNSGDAIVIDAGTGIRELGNHLIENKKDIIHLIFTHYHWDHIQGFPYFAPIFFEKSEIYIYGHKKDVTTKNALIYQMTKPYFPIALSELPSKIVFKELKNRMKIGDLLIETIVNNHPDYTYGLKFTEKIYEQRIGWGHSTHSQVMKLAKDAGVKNIIFTHHDHASTDKFIDKVLKDLRNKYPGQNIQAAADGRTIILK